MTYHTELGADPELSRERNFTVDNHVCRPKFADTRATFKAVQAQINRLADRMGTTRVGVDGDIGPKTVTALNKILEKSFTLRAKLFKWSYPGCFDIAIDAANVAAKLKAQADSMPAPKTPSAPPAAEAEAQLAPAPLTSGFSLDILKSPVGLAALGVVAVLILRKQKGGKSRSRRRR